MVRTHKKSACIFEYSQQSSKEEWNFVKHVEDGPSRQLNDIGKAAGKAANGEMFRVEPRVRHLGVTEKTV